MTATLKAKPRILLLGDPVEGSIERELYDFLNSHKRYAEPRVQSKHSVSLQDDVKDSDLIVMFCNHAVPERRDGDVKLLQHLRDFEKRGELLLFAEDFDEVLTLIDRLNIQDSKVFKLTSDVDRQRRLLQAILNWIATRDELLMQLGTNDKAASQPALAAPKPKPWLEFAGLLRKEVIATAVAALIAVGGYLARDRIEAASKPADEYVLSSASGFGDIIDERGSRLRLGDPPTLSVRLEKLPALECTLSFTRGGESLKIDSVEDGDGPGDRYDGRRFELRSLLMQSSFRVVKDGQVLTRLEREDSSGDTAKQLQFMLAK